MTCIHHWIIEPPNGPKSKGICIKCGDVSLFPNEIMLTAEWKYLEDLGSRKRKEKRERKLRSDFAIVGTGYGKVNP